MTVNIHFELEILMCKMSTILKSYSVVSQKLMNLNWAIVTDYSIVSICVSFHMHYVYIIKQNYINDLFKEQAINCMTNIISPHIL